RAPAPTAFFIADGPVDRRDRQLTALPPMTWPLPASYPGDPRRLMGSADSFAALGIASHRTDPHETPSPVGLVIGPGDAGSEATFDVLDARSTRVDAFHGAVRSGFVDDPPRVRIAGRTRPHGDVLRWSWPVLVRRNLRVRAVGFL